MPKYTRASSGRSIVMFIAGSLTVGLLVGAAFLGWKAHPGACSEGGTYACMTAADWGNFFAGVFAPIAFIWLVAAVWIQSQELAEQREELRLTRLEFEENRTVMQEQANEARRQAEFIGLQTEILKRQDSDRVSERSQKDLDDAIQTISDLIHHNLSDVKILVGTDINGQEAWVAFTKATRSKDDYILHFVSMMSRSPEFFGIVGHYSVNPEVLDMINLASQMVDGIIALGKATGPRGTMTIERLKIKEFSVCLTRMLADHQAAGARRIAEALLKS
ncbi:hypothetical protein ASC97_05675 [Rhizobium sp. Root1203]|uniref:hypothetical protein n=1 Tax=Rhizobium sp. Root1203 TaxID=1736427 RepID=UPI00070EECC5|nr:hypothetical protein [Rhizobium sp. Root1203]KQV27853.1 hypothetical protein ASC97_05675 [Rhizobium sp. Root1203]